MLSVIEKQPPYEKSASIETAEPLEESPAAEHARMLANIWLDKFRWNKGGFGVVALASFSLRNGNGFDLKDFALHCQFYGASRTQIGEVTTILYQAVKAHSTKPIESFNVGFINSQTASGGCEVIDAQR